jgi:hypothetical protein
MSTGLTMHASICIKKVGLYLNAVVLIYRGETMVMLKR